MKIGDLVRFKGWIDDNHFKGDDPVGIGKILDPFDEIEENEILAQFLTENGGTYNIVFLKEELEVI